MKRRDFLRVAMIGGSATFLGLPNALRAAEPALTPTPKIFDTLPWQTSAFDATTISSALKILHGDITPILSKDIKLDIPVFAESAAMVPVTVSTKLGDVSAIHIMVLNNPRPLTMSFDILRGAIPFVSSRVWLTKDSDVAVYVKSYGKLYYAHADVLLQGTDGCVTHKIGA